MPVKNAWIRQIRSAVFITSGEQIVALLVKQNYGNLAATGRVPLHKKARSRRAAYAVDEIHARHEQDFVADVFGGFDHYSLSVSCIAIAAKMIRGAGAKLVFIILKLYTMDAIEVLKAESRVAEQFFSQHGCIVNEHNQDKRTIDEEADLTAEEVEQMEHNKAQQGSKGNDTSDRKGSSGPEEKDISV